MKPAVFTDEQKNEILRIALYAGEIMLKNGAETYRVEDTVIRICDAKGLKYVNAFVTPTVIMISDSRFDGKSLIRRIYSRDTNLEKVSHVNDFSRLFSSDPQMSFRDALTQLKQIDALTPYPYWLQLICAGGGAFSFALLFGSGFNDAVIAFFVAAFSIFIYGILQRISEISFLANFISSFIIGLSALTVNLLIPNTRFDMIIVGSIMPLLPGFALTNGLRDFISGDLISGTSRVSEAFIIAVSIAFGVGSAFKIFMALGGLIS